MAVFRRFFDITKAMLLALLLCFVSTNSFAVCAERQAYNIPDPVKGDECPEGWGFSNMLVTGNNVGDTNGKIGSCFQCARGKYKDWEGNDPCESCPAGGTTDCPGTISSRSCRASGTGPGSSTTIQNCASGYYNAISSSLTYTCTPCGIGTYSNGGLITKCQACPAGTTTYDEGSTSCNATCSNDNGRVLSWVTPALSRFGAILPGTLCAIEQCEDGYYLYKENIAGLFSDGECQDCPSGYTCDGTTTLTEAQTITIDWDENGGSEISNGSCTYGGNLTLPGAQTRDGYLFLGWKLANGTVKQAGETVSGGCTETYTGVESGTSTAISAGWQISDIRACPACNSTANAHFASCEATSYSGNTCTYTYTCEDGYHNFIFRPGANSITSGTTDIDLLNVGISALTDGFFCSVANTITIDWNEDGGDEISNGSCTYDGNLTLPSAPTRNDGYAFAGWKLTDGTIKSAGETVTNGCTETYTGVTSGTSTNIQALWDTDCQCIPGNHVASCSARLLNSTSCYYSFTCESGYYTTGSKNLVSSGSLTDGLASSSSGICSPECYAPVRIDWDENGGTARANGGCVISPNASFSLPGAPTRTGYKFAGWILADGTISTGGAYPCNSTYLGASNGETSTAIKAHWEIADGYYDDGYGNAVQCPSGYRDGVGAHNIYGCYASDAITCQDYHGYDTGAETITYATPNSSVSCKRYYDAPDRCVLDNPAACNITNLSCDTGYYTPIRTEISSRWDVSGPSTITFKNNNALICTQTNRLTSLTDCDDSVFDGIAPGDWVAQYSSVGIGQVYGVARCSATTGTNYTAGNPDFSTTGDNCWCRVEKQANGLNLNETKPTVSSWVHVSGTNCKSNCTAACSLGMFTSEDFRSALYSSIKQDCALYNYSVEIYRSCPSDSEEEECDTPSQPWLCQSSPIDSNGLDIDYGQAFSVPAPSACDGYTFNGWNITNMDSSTHYVGTSDANLTTTNATSLSNVTYTRYKNLRSSGLASSSVTFTAQWTRGCASNEMLYTDPDTNETTCIPSEFELTIDTTKGDNTKHFEFYLGATGTFYVDWGDGNVQKIEKSDISALSKITHDYTAHYNGSVRFGGEATGYLDTGGPMSAIRFNMYTAETDALLSSNKNVKKITGFTGSLGSVFPTVGTQQPQFYATFAYATNMVATLTSDLFAGVHGAPINYMFSQTFSNCPGLTGTIPAELFCHGDGNPNIDSCIYGAPTKNLFKLTFAHTGVSGTIPEKLFAGIHGAPAEGMFDGTFAVSGVSGQIPETLFCRFANGRPNPSDCIYGAPKDNMFTRTFDHTGVSGTIPAKLFAGIHGAPAEDMFNMTFAHTGVSGTIPENLFCYQALTYSETPSTSNCIYGVPENNMFGATFAYTNLSGQIPAHLFVGIIGAPAEDMFSGTFANSGVSGQIPANLFAGIHGAPAEGMFDGTFFGCENLTGQIPESLFCQAVANNETPSISNCIYGAPEQFMFEETFKDCSGLTSYIPPKLFVGISQDSTATDQMTGVFYGSGIAESCEPYGMDQYITGFEDWFDGKVSCESGCPSGQFKYRDPNTHESTCIDSEFEVTIDTTKGDGSKKFGFKISAAGTFYVDWGDGTVDMYERSNTIDLIEHTYTNHYNGQVRFNGTPTGYTNSHIAAIRFNTYDRENDTELMSDTNHVKKITGVSGKLGNVFGTVDNPISGTGSQPKFFRTFSYATNWTGSIPADLFAGIHGEPAEGMFYMTFGGCTDLTGPIPESLFCQALANNETPSVSNCIYGAPAKIMFLGTFSDSGVSGSIPAKLFAGIHGEPAGGMFSGTFAVSGVSGQIPAKLFAGIYGAPAEDMFNSTFTGSSVSGQIPESLFCQAVANNETPNASNCIYGAPAEGMFIGTFSDSGVSGSIPAKLFAGIHGAPTDRMFDRTFAGSGVSGQIPESLFCQAVANNEIPNASNCIFGDPAGGMFSGTFQNCSGLSSYIPPKLFVGISQDSTAADQMTGVFSGSGLATSCEPYGMDQYFTGFESWFDGKVSCESACPSGQFKYRNPNTNESTCIPSKFELTIDTSLGDNSKKFEFYLGAAGTFYVDWGDGTVQKIDKTNNTNGTVVSHTYDTDYNGTVKLGGEATGYSSSASISFSSGSTPSIDQYNKYKITGISGSLGAIFKTLDNPLVGVGQPNFPRIFFECSNLTGTIPANLFANVHGAPTPHMFNETFGFSGISGQIPESLFCQALANNETPSASNCIYGAPQLGVFAGTFRGTGVSGQIPAKLFAGIHGAPADSMFQNTFEGCEGLTGSIPASLFCQALANNATPSASNCIYGAPAQSMFSDTFYNTNVSGQIPTKLFVGIHGEPAAGMFSNTFYGTHISGQIPESLFCQALANNATPSASNCIFGAPKANMFYNTFANTDVSGQIPAKLFVGIHGETASGMFDHTFANCRSLTGTIPETLFCQDVNNPSVDNCIVGDKKSSMFQSTFADCSGLSGYIPPKLFVGISSTSSSAYRPMDYVFSRSGIAESCEPYGMEQYITGFESYFDHKVSCDCAEGSMKHIDQNTGAITCVPSEFELTIDTTKGDGSKKFGFKISAAGTFYVDWGDGTVDLYERSNTNIELIEHTYTNHYNGQVRFNGTPTGYNSTISAIRFNTYNQENDTELMSDTNHVKKITGVSGKLGTVFSTVANPISGTVGQPAFIRTFSFATNWTGSIPADLFDGIDGAPIGYMFYATFWGSGVTGSIPSSLFSGVHGVPAEAMFRGTFAECSGLSGQIPESLFCQALANNENPSASKCIFGAPASGMFMSTFWRSGVSGSIPAKLFVGIRGIPSPSLFNATFAESNVSGQIPATLFSGLHGDTANGVFKNTFYGCSGLEGQIPESLFCQALANNETPSASKCIFGAPKHSLFYQTFYGCSGLSSYIPPKLFVGISQDSTATDQMTGVFSGSGIAESCEPYGMEQYPTGFEQYFSGKVSCVTQYTIHYELGLNETLSEDSPTTFAEYRLPVQLGTATKPGYTFDGWRDNAQLNGVAITEIPVGTNHDVTLYPKWVVQGYTIHYHIDENTTLESGTITSFNVESLPVTLKSATKTGYVFGGWYDNEDLTGDVVTTIPANTLTDVDLWPKFTPITYTITFNTNGGDGFKYPVTCTYDVDCDISNRGEIVFEGWTFTGWALSKRAQTPDYPDNAGDIIVRNLTSTNGQNVFVYAIWDANTISLTYNYKDDTNSSNTNMCTFDSSFVLPTPSEGAKAGYRFIGWRVREEESLQGYTQE